MMNCHRLWYCIALILTGPLYAHPFFGINRHLLENEKSVEAKVIEASIESVAASSEGFEFEGDTVIPLERVFSQRLHLEPLDLAESVQLETPPEHLPSAFDGDLDLFGNDVFGTEHEALPIDDSDDTEPGQEEILDDILTLLNVLWDSSASAEESESDDTRRKSKSLKDELEEGNAGIVVRLTKRALVTAAQNITNFLVYDISRLSISDITLRSMDLNITLHGIKTHSYVPPAVDISVQDDILTLKTTKGSVNLFGQYTAVYKTVRQGIIEARMSGFDVNLKLRMRTSESGSLNFEVHSCEATVETLHVDLMRHLLDQVTDDVREALHALSTSSICKYFHTYVDKLNTHLNEVMALKQVNVHCNVPQGQLNFDMTLSDKPVLFHDHIDVPMFGEFIGSSSRTPFKPHKLMKRIDDTEKMIYIYMSDFILNSFFYQLEAIAEWKGKLHRVPEIAKALRLSCGEDEDCFGKYVDNIQEYVEHSGRMYVVARDRPQVSLTDRRALLKMNLSIEATYQMRDYSTPTTVLRFNVALQLHVDSFSVLTNQTTDVEGEKRYKVNASGGIDQLEVDEIHIFDENWRGVETHLPLFVARRKPKLEMMLRENMHTVLSFSDSGIPAINSVDGQFRRSTLVLGFDIDMQSAISDFLQLPEVFT